MSSDDDECIHFGFPVKEIDDSKTESYCDKKCGYCKSRVRTFEIIKTLPQDGGVELMVFEQTEFDYGILSVS